jgi:hypothetical protein
MSSMELLYILFNEKLDLVSRISIVRFLRLCCGNLIGGPLGDRFGRISFGFQFWEPPLPCFCLTLICFGLEYYQCYRNYCSGIFGHLVFAQDWCRVSGMISGLFFGFAFGMGVGFGYLGVFGWSNQYRICL